MLYQIVSLLLDVVVGLVGGACLLRLFMQHQRVPFGNPVGSFVFALTNWIILPLRKVTRPIGRWDTASLIAAYLLQLAQYLVLWLLLGAGGGLERIPFVALFGLAKLAISAMTVLVIVGAILSWVRTDSPVSDVIERLTAPLLRPFRRVIPLVGGIDLSPLALLVLLQIASIVLASAQSAALR
ncbi:MAG TPA: YggT family protein [Ramlibacter sp.]|nr:YggT family protein [Ramlibacter sp.]